MRSFGFFVNHREFDSAKAGFFHRRLQFDFAEAKPFIGIELASFFKAMLREVEYCDPAARFENSPGFGDCTLRMQRVMERLREEDKVDGGVIDWHFFHVS